jgi:4-hydroxy-2-oxoheptanedioate aldolase
MNGGAIYGVWASSASPDLEMAARRLDVDYLVADLQHGSWTFREMERLFSLLGERTTGRCRPWVRTNPAPSDAEIGHCLDAGAWGLIVPYVDSRDRLRAARRAMHYPPDGVRSFGRNIGMLNSGTRDADAYVRWSRDAIELFAIVESRAGLDRLEEIVEAADGVLFGLADFSLDADVDTEACLERIARRLERCPVRTMGYLGIDSARQRALGANVVNLGNVKDFIAETVDRRYRELGVLRTTTPIHED